MTRLLAISGSLRRVSTNTALLKAMAGNAPLGTTLELFDDLGGLPIFNPDHEDELTPESVLHLASHVRTADGLVISCPEYAHGIPGGLKNALDWLVSRDEIPFKPVMLVRASQRNDISHASLQEVLRTMSVRLMPEPTLSIHLLGKKSTEIEQALAAPQTRADLVAALERFVEWITQG
jgi:NAD(P)H-dependent FMN reductase